MKIGRLRAAAERGDLAEVLAIARAVSPLAASPEPPPEGRQMILSLVDVTIWCEALEGDVPACVCIARQAKSDIQRTQQTSRGQGTDHPSCDSRTCEQGRRIREALDPASGVTWKGAGPGGRFERGRQGRGRGGSVEGSGA
jgi:hypothetical protein